MNNQVTSPETFFRFQLGCDRKIAAWNKIVAYLRLLEQESDCLQVLDMGPSTEGNPFLLAFISSPQNLVNLERLQAVNAEISDARGLSEDAAKSLISEGKVVLCQSMGLHATEIGSTQMASELTYDLITRSVKKVSRRLSSSSRTVERYLPLTERVSLRLRN